MRLLVIEDDPDLNRQLATALTDAGYVVDRAFDGEEGHYLGETEPYDLGNGYGHVAFSVEDVESERRRFEESGFEPRRLVELEKDGQVLGKFFFVKDPDGYQIEVLQRAGRYL